MRMSDASMSAATLIALGRIVLDDEELSHARRDEFLDAREYRLQSLDGRDWS
jgi:hypothetical protein